jgi:hypothetical protein
LLILQSKITTFKVTSHHCRKQAKLLIQSNKIQRPLLAITGVDSMLNYLHLKTAGGVALEVPQANASLEVPFWHRPTAQKPPTITSGKGNSGGGVNYAPEHGCVPHKTKTLQYVLGRFGGGGNVNCPRVHLHNPRLAVPVK